MKRLSGLIVLGVSLVLSAGAHADTTGTNVQSDQARAAAVRAGSLVIVTGVRQNRSSHMTYSQAIDDGINAVNTARDCVRSPCGFTVELINGRWIRSSVQTGTDQELMDYLQAPTGSGVTSVIMHPTGRTVTVDDVVGTHADVPQAATNNAQQN